MLMGCRSSSRINSNSQVCVQEKTNRGENREDREIGVGVGVGECVCACVCMA